MNGSGASALSKHRRLPVCKLRHAGFQGYAKKRVPLATFLAPLRGAAVFADS